MPPVAIPFPSSHSPGARARLSGGKLTNAILEKLGDGRTLVKRAPGLLRSVYQVSDHSHCRGMGAANDSTFFAVFDDALQSVTVSGTGGTATALTAVPGTDLVTIARNNAATPDVVCVSPTNGAFELDTGAGASAYSDADVQSPNSVCFTGGYFFFTYSDGRCRASGLNVTAINSLDEARFESKTGGLLRGIPYRGQLLLMGTLGIEVWQADPANAVGFPFSRVAIIPRGLAGTNAVAGSENGFPETIIWAGEDNIVYQLNGYDPVRISSHDLEHDLQDLADKTTLHAFVFMSNGHPFWCLKCDDWTWVYDLLTQTWQARKSYGLANWRAEQSVFLRGGWYLGDDDSGHIFRPSDDAYQEDGDFLIFEAQSAAVTDFPARSTVPRVDFDFVAGQGSPVTVEDPQVIIDWSEDGGATWSRPVYRSLGRIGEYENRVSVNRAGRTGPYGRCWRVTVSDPAYVGFLGGVMHAEQRAVF